jgi:hypothetical protein
MNDSHRCSRTFRPRTGSTTASSSGTSRCCAAWCVQQCATGDDPVTTVPSVVDDMHRYSRCIQSPNKRCTLGNILRARIHCLAFALAARPHTTVPAQCCAHTCVLQRVLWCPLVAVCVSSYSMSTRRGARSTGEYRQAINCAMAALRLDRKGTPGWRWAVGADDGAHPTSV